jgi:hypothetical protein
VTRNASAISHGPGVRNVLRAFGSNSMNNPMLPASAKAAYFDQKHNASAIPAAIQSSHRSRVIAR